MNFIASSPSSNPFDNTAVEVIRLIASNLPCEPEAVGALALCNQDLESILDDMIPPEAIAYAAIRSLDRDLVSMTIRKRGADTMVLALTRTDIYDIYALNVVVKNNREDLFGLIEPFITAEHPSTHVAACSASGYGYYPLLRRLMPYLAEDTILEIFEMMCNGGIVSEVVALLALTPTQLRPKLCTLNMESAVTSGRVELLRVLIEGGTDLNTIMISGSIDWEERTCLHWLGIYWLRTNQLNNGFSPMIKMFCQAGGADLNALDCQGRNVLHEFALNGSKLVTPSQLFEDDFTNERPDWLYECALREIIEAGANVNQQDEFGKTPLHYAVQNRQSVMVRSSMSMASTRSSRIARASGPVRQMALHAWLRTPWNSRSS
jgi:hypothetical protein